MITIILVVSSKLYLYNLVVVLISIYIIFTFQCQFPCFSFPFLLNKKLFFGLLPGQPWATH